MTKRSPTMHQVLLDMLFSAIQNDPEALQHLIDEAIPKLASEDYQRFFGLLMEQMLLRGLHISISFEGVTFMEIGKNHELG